MTLRGEGPGGAGGAPPWPQGPWVAVVGARPNFVKLAPLVRAAAAAGGALPWIDAGQHVDPALTRRLWDELELPPPRARAPHEPPGRGRAARMAARLLPLLADARPSLVVVVGDVDAAVGGALAARRLGVPLAHVEAGLRCGDRRLPEERNRVRIDRLGAHLHVPEPAAAGLLAREGVARGRIHRAGNVLADAVAWARPRLRLPQAPWARRFAALGGGLVTLHRGANVDDPARLARFAAALAALGRELPLVFPVHPRTARTLGAAARRSLARAGVTLTAPLGPLELLGLLAVARLAVTDSGGLPVEASLLGVSCLTLRPRYEHTLTLSHGTNAVIGADPRRVLPAARAALASPRAPRALPAAWDGRAAVRIVARWQAARARGPGGSYTK